MKLILLIVFVCISCDVWSIIFAKYFGVRPVAFETYVRNNPVEAYVKVNEIISDIEEKE